MNHDYTHCLDYKPNCPKDCFRAQITKDLKNRIDLIGMTFTWMHFENTDECGKKRRPAGDRATHKKRS